MIVDPNSLEGGRFDYYMMGKILLVVGAIIMIGAGEINKAAVGELMLVAGVLVFIIGLYNDVKGRVDKKRKGKHPRSEEGFETETDNE